MASVGDLPLVSDGVTGNDYLLGWRSAGVRFTMASLLEYVQAHVVTSDNKLTQYKTPSTGFSLSVGDGFANGSSVWVVLTPTGTLATGTLVLPAASGCVEKQEILVSSSQEITSLTINGNGATVVGGPSTIAAGGFFRLRFEPVTSVWYRVG